VSAQRWEDRTGRKAVQQSNQAEAPPQQTDDHKCTEHYARSRVLQTTV